MVTPVEWRVTTLPDGRYRVDDGTRSLIAHAIRDGATTWIWIDGHLLELTPPTTSRARTAHADDSLMPQMSAKVIRVLVTDGQSVAAGDVLVVLEAMKMEMPIKAPRSGVIAKVNCAQGDLVQPGTAVVDMSNDATA